MLRDAQHSILSLPANHAGSARRFASGGLALLFVWLAGSAGALTPAEADRLLKQADAVKTGQHADFVVIMKQLDESREQLTPAQKEYVRYLEGWKSALDLDYDTALARLTTVIDESKDDTLRFRATATIINVLAISARHQDAFARLSELIELLPKIQDANARAQGMLVAGYIYNELAQYDLSLKHAQSVIDENRDAATVCKGGQVKVRARFESGKLRTVGSEFQAAIDACLKAGETQWANWIRTYAAKLYIRQKRYDDAVKLLKDHYEEARATQYRRLLAAFDALLAQAYRDKGELPLAQRSALDAVEHAVKNEYTEPLVVAYRVLYEIAKEQGDTNMALSFHEKYAEADKGYLDDVSARQMAYQRVKHETTANQLQIEALNKQNEVLRLERALGAKAVENSRLYIALLATVLVFMMLWFYKTKRLQLHFKSLSQKDGLTGIANRPHFISQAEAALEESKKTQQELCILLCDLDHFKMINDRHGHPTGDLVLKQAVNACQAHLRSADIFGRFGGEEFGILLPGCDIETARQRSEELRVAIAETAGKQGDFNLNVSASFGVASTRASGYELRQLLAHADTALYQAKRGGRNRVMLYDATAPTDGLLLDISERLRGVGA
jgi:diguanylate cyclase (GGDEF)-like protein